MVLSKMLFNSALFKNKSQKDITDLLASMNYGIKKYQKNETILSVDEPTHSIGIILSGKIEIQKNFASGKIVTISHKEDGDLFGEGSVFSKASTYPCNIFAKTNVTALFITKSVMLTLISNDVILLDNLLNSLANRVLVLNLTTELLSYSCIQQKIAFSLLNMMGHYRSHHIITLPYSKKTWAECLNISRPSLFRELKVLCTKKILSVENRTITILNKDALNSLLNN